MTRSIFVTGSNQGLGMHTVHQLASTPEILVFMGSRKLEAAEEALAKFAVDIHSSSCVVPVQLDITDEASIKDAYNFISEYLEEKGMGGLNVLVNNAAIGPGSFKQVYEVNVFGTVAVTEVFRPLLLKGGAILNISSGLGSIAFYTKRPALPLSPAYATSKVALNGLTAMWALREEREGSGIRVVSIDPGFNATNLNGYRGTMTPAEGCKVIVKAALEEGGKTAIFFNKDGELEW